MSLCLYDCRAVREHPGLVGVDEAGRGAWAGPVVAAAVWFEAPFYADRRRRREGRRINDSKKLPPAARADCFTVIEAWQMAGLVRVAAASAGVEEIATHNILGATRLAMERCLRVLHAAGAGLPTIADDAPLFAAARPNGPASRPRVLIDGRPLRPFSWPHEAVVGGDARCFAIAAASIVAKVTRDRLLAQLDGAFPGYGLAGHKGYGTREHQEVLRRLGPTPQHRALFLRKFQGQFPGAPDARQSEIAW
jgi:ribonuclease HII